MLLFDLCAIGNKLLCFRKKRGMTQAEVAEAAGLSDRTYADIERGTVNMRIETLLHICAALYITPNDVLTADQAQPQVSREQFLELLDSCDPKERDTAMLLVSVYLNSLN